MAPDALESSVNSPLEDQVAQSTESASAASVERPIDPESPAVQEALADRDAGIAEARSGARAALGALREEIRSSMWSKKFAAYDPESPTRTAKSPARTAGSPAHPAGSSTRSTEASHGPSAKKPDAAPLSPDALKERVSKINTQMLPRTLSVNESGEVAGARTGRSYGSIDIGTFRMVAEEGYYRFFEDKHGAYSVSSEWLTKMEGASKITVHRERNAQGENVPYVMSGGKRYDATGKLVSR